MQKLFITGLKRVALSLLVAVALVFAAPQSSFAQDAGSLGIDAGISCDRTADCASVGKNLICQDRTCVLPESSIKFLGKSNIKEVKDLEEASKLATFEGKTNVLDHTGNKIVPSVVAKTICLIDTCDIPDENGNIQAGLNQSMIDMIAFMYGNPVATPERYIADVLDSAGVGVVQPAYAQGLGFTALDPVLEAWKKFRDISYIIFVLVIMVIGFMIMLRQKVGQAAVTAQQALPNIIMTLIIVSFSYAIAGILIEAMYLVMLLMVLFFQVEQSVFLAVGPIELGMRLVIGGASEGYEITRQAVASLIGEGLAIDNFAGLAVGLIVALAVAFGIFRLLFELLKTYISILISVTLAPLMLMLGAIPGRNPFGTWIKSLVGNLAAFPVVLLLLIIFNELTGGLTGAEGSFGSSSGGFAPPYLFGSFAAGDTGGTAAQFIIGLGILLTMTDLVKQAKKSLGAGSGFDQFGTALTDSLKKGWSGGELIPGLGWSKIPGASQIGKFGANQSTKPVRWAGRQAWTRYETTGNPFSGLRGVKQTKPYTPPGHDRAPTAQETAVDRGNVPVVQKPIGKVDTDKF